MTDSLLTILADYPVKHSVEVQWGEMDAFQHVNATVYLRWAETARVTYFRLFQDHTIDLAGKGVGPILAYIQCKYIFPVTYPDTVVIGTHISDFKTDRIKMDHLMVSTRHERAVALVESWIVTYDYQKMAKVELPVGLSKAITQFEQQHAL